MGEKDLYDFWSNTHKVHYGMEWNREVASSILSEWQAKFSQEVATLVKEKQMHKKYQINAFSSSYLNDILATFSEYDVFSLSLSYLFVVSILQFIKIRQIERSSALCSLNVNKVSRIFLYFFFYVKFAFFGVIIKTPSSGQNCHEVNQN